MQKNNYSSIMIRNFDSDANSDILTVMTDFMSEKDIKSAQKAIEGILRDYSVKKHKINRLELTYKEKEINHQSRIKQLEEENEKMKTALSYFDCFTKSLQQINLK